MTRIHIFSSWMIRRKEQTKKKMTKSKWDRLGLLDVKFAQALLIKRIRENEGNILASINTRIIWAPFPLKSQLKATPFSALLASTCDATNFNVCLSYKNKEPKEKVGLHCFQLSLLAQCREKFLFIFADNKQNITLIHLLRHFCLSPHTTL